MKKLLRMEGASEHARMPRIGLGIIADPAISLEDSSPS